MSTRTGITRPDPDIYTPGGALSETDPVYVSRAADTELLESIRNGQFCFVLTPRQMGKSSLMYRTAAKLRERGIRTAVVDLTGIGGGASADEWYLGHLVELSTQLALTTDYQSWWERARHLSAVQRFTKFLTDVVLVEVSEPVVIFVDEIDTTLRLSYSDDYFAAIRSLYNRRAAEPALRRLTFALLGVASPSELIKDPVRTPFNIGRRIHLTDFQTREALPLAAGLSPDPALSQTLLERILFWSGGHPYLTQSGCRCVAEWADSAQWNPADVPEIVDQLVEENFLSERGRNTDANLQFVTERVTESDAAVQMLRLYRRIRRADAVLDDELDPVRMTLKLSGLVKATDARVLEVRNRIYERVFDEAWVRSELARREQPVEDEEAGLKRLIPKFLRGETKFKYDVFVSYSHRDSEWVNAYLVPNLRQARLSIIHALEIPVVVEQGIQNSRSVILVLSPAFVANEYAVSQIERPIRLADEDPERRVIPLMLRKVTLPLALRRFAYVDFTNEKDWDRQMERLFEALDAPRNVRPIPASLRSKRSQPKDTGIIRQLLNSAFEDEDLVAFAYDYFRPAYADLQPELSKNMKIQKLIEYADREGLLDELLDRIAQARPSEYRRVSQRFERGPAAG